MRRLVLMMVVMVWGVGCDDADEACSTLDVTSCAEDAACTVINGTPTQETADGICADYDQASEPVGCLAAETDCDAAMSFGYDPAVPDAVYSFGGCVPEGWESDSSDWAECVSR